jgi:hypothetical protein
MLAATKARVCSLVNTFVTSFPPAVVHDIAEGTMAFYFEKPAGGWTLRAGSNSKSAVRHHTRNTKAPRERISAGPFCFSRSSCTRYAGATNGERLEMSCEMALPRLAQNYGLDLAPSRLLE